MLLDPNDTMDLLNRLDAGRQDPPNGTSRRFKRHIIRGQARIESIDLTDMDEMITVTLRDVSRAGVGFVADRFIEPCTMWRMFLTNGSFIAGSIVIIIRFCRAVTSDMYLCGGQTVIEPFLLHQLGVPMDEARHETQCSYSDHDVADFLTPDQV